MTPKEKEFLDEYRELLDFEFEFKIGEMEYSSSAAFEAIDPIAFKLGLQEFIEFKEEDEEYVEYLNSPAGIAETKEGKKRRESLGAYSETDDEEPDIKFKFPPRKFQFKSEWQKVNKSWKGILKNGER
tara:strand:- start:912 stop:1295 length:384 start_codon:yes stop_codon:yes gene_type:complete